MTLVVFENGIFSSRDEGLCVRNSPFRELLGATGVWRLNDPTQHVVEGAADASDQAFGGGSGDFIRELLSLRLAFDKAQAKARRDLARSRTIPEARTAFEAYLDTSRRVVASLKQLDAPPPFDEVADIAIDTNQLQVEAGEKFLRALRSKDGPQIRAAYRNLLEVETKQVRRYRVGMKELRARYDG